MIRQMTAKDIKGVLEIYNDAIINTTAVYIYKPQTLEERISWFQAKNEGNYPVFIFEEDGQVAGFATYGPFRSYPAYKYTIEHSVYVHKDHYKKGIATKLMAVLIEEAAKAGYVTMVAGIDSGNGGSIKMHEKLGFSYSGTIKKAGYKFGQWLDLAYYQLELNGTKVE